MPILQCGFVASEPQVEGVEPLNSHSISAALAVPVALAAPSTPCTGGWGFALAISADGTVNAWGVNAATLLAKSGGNDGGVDPACVDLVAAGASGAAAGFDHGLIINKEGQVLVFGPAYKAAAAAAAAGVFLSPVPFKVAIVQVAAGELSSTATAALTLRLVLELKSAVKDADAAGWREPCHSVVEHLCNPITT